MKIQVIYPTDPKEDGRDSAWLNVNDDISSDEFIDYLYNLDKVKFTDGRAREPLPKSDENGKPIKWEVLRQIKTGERLEGPLLRENRTLIVRRAYPLRPAIEPG